MGRSGPNVQQLGQDQVLSAAVADVAVMRERARWNRLRRVALMLALLAAWMWGRLITGVPVTWGWPAWTQDMIAYLPALLLIVLFGIAIFVPLLGAGRSPHVMYRPGEIDITLADVKGIGIVRDEAIKTLNLFLAFKTFKEQMGGSPRRAILFEGPPGTGKTYMAKAIAREAGVPFLFVSSSAFQSMYYGQTNRKIRAFFRSLRRAARQEGGAIGFIEEIDAIGASRSGMGGHTSEGIPGVVNELLIQLQSFDAPTRGQRVLGWFLDHLNRWLPLQKQVRMPKPMAANILVIGATNRAADLDPALVRPGRFDRAIHFDLPNKGGRREIIDYYLEKKSHTSELDDPSRRDALAAMTFGYSPVMIEHLFDEALVWAIRRGASELSWADIQQAKFTEEVGLKQAVEYTPAERERIATHEAGHATIAHAVAPERKLELLSIIKRRDALGMLAHSDVEERFTRTKSELIALIKIALGGMVAEAMFLGEAGTGASGDLNGATSLAAQMVGSMGMAGSLISYEAIQGPMRENVVSKVLANDKGRAAVEEILTDAKRSVQTLIHSNKRIVEGLRDALLEKDELIGDEILGVIEASLAPAVPFRHHDASEPELGTGTSGDS